MTTTYIPLATTAKMIRAALAKNFPGVKFYVRSKSYAGGASIDVYYDGLDHYAPDPYNGNGHHNFTAVYKPGMPAKADVEAVTSGYASRGFDGMIDMAYRVDATLDANGDVVATASTGTVGSHGSVPAWGDKDAASVTFGASYVFVNTELPYDVRKAA
jgi:hypothetical protein